MTSVLSYGVVGLGDYKTSFFRKYVPDFPYFVLTFFRPPSLPVLCLLYQDSSIRSIRSLNLPVRTSYKHSYHYHTETHKTFPSRIHTKLDPSPTLSSNGEIRRSESFFVRPTSFSSFPSFPSFRALPESGNLVISTVL